MTPLDAAARYIENGLYPVPVPYREKGPKTPGWQKLRLRGEDLPNFFNGAARNIGVLVGENGLADIDCDCTEAVEAARLLAPQTGMVFGRNSKPASHYFYYAAPAVTLKKYTDPTNNKTLVELRCLKQDGSVGLQTIVPPSVHECGERVRFEQGGDGHPAKIEGYSLGRAVARIATASLLARHWPAKGSRHNAMLALAGGLCRAGMPVGEAKQFCHAVYVAVPTHDPSAVRRSDSEVQDTYEKALGIAEDGEEGKVTGWPTLAGIVGDKVVDVALRWLNIGVVNKVESAGPQTGAESERERANMADPQPDPPAITAAELVEQLRVNPDVALLYKHIGVLAALPNAEIPAIYDQLKEILGKKLTHRDFDPAMRDARSGLRRAAAERRDEELSHPYRVKDGRIIRLKAGKDNSIEEIPLTNFTAWIKSEVEEDDGAEVKRFFGIEADVLGKPFSFILPVTQFNGMEWPTQHMGAHAIVLPNQSEQARAAIQSLSTKITYRRIYTHTGWRKIDGVWQYLNAGGSIGPGGLMKGVEVRLSGALAHYQIQLPDTREQRIEAVRASLGVLEVAPAHITFPLLAAVYRACIKTCDFALWFGGPTGVFKSELAALAQRHYGAEMDSRHLPGNFASTGNALEVLAFHAKDALVVVDDFAPYGGTQDVARYHAAADRLLRAAGNNQGRGRLTSDARLREAKPPRGLILATGEDLPRGQSIRGRTFIVEVAPGDVRKEVLTQCQSAAADGQYATAMGGFMQFVAANYECIQSKFAARVAELRGQAASAHSRTPGIVADLQAGFEYFLSFATVIGAIPSADREQLWGAAWKALNQLARAQQLGQRDSEPAQRFIVLLRAALVSGQAHVADVNGKPPANRRFWGWRDEGNSQYPREVAKGQCVGWIDGTDLYLEPTAAYAVAQEVGRATGEPLAVTALALRKRLKEKGLLASVAPARGTNTIRRTILGGQREVLHVHSGVLLNDVGFPGVDVGFADAARQGFGE